MMMFTDDDSLNGHTRLYVNSRMRDQSFRDFIGPLKKVEGFIYEVLLDRLIALEGTEHAASISVLNALTDITEEIQCLVAEYFYELGQQEESRGIAKNQALSTKHPT